MTTTTDVQIPLDSATRREFITLLGAAGLLSACGDGGDFVAPANSGSVTQRVDHALGSSEVRPATDISAVVVLEGRRDLETALALGLPLVGAPSASPDEPFPAHLAGMVDGVEPLFARGEPNLEAIANTTPDLIISRTSNAEEIFAELSAIAPVLPVAGDGPWRNDLRFVADALQIGVQADERIADHDERQLQIAEADAGALKRKIAVVQYNNGGTLFWSAPDGFLLQAQVLDELGGSFVDAQRGAGDQSDFSAEQIGEFLADAEAIMLITGLDPTADLNELGENPLWKGLRAVQANAVEVAPFQLNYGSVIAANACLDRFQALFGRMG